MTLSSTYEDYLAFDIEPPFCLAYAAPTNAGKSTNILNLLKYRWSSSFDNVVIACPSLEFDENDYKDVKEVFDEHTKLTLIHDDFLIQLKTIIEDQKLMKRLNKSHPEAHPPTHTLMILDDCIGTNLIKSNRKDNIVDDIATMGRHFLLSVIVTTQVLSELSYAVRRNATGLFVFAPMNYTDFERVLDEYVPQEYRFELRARARDIFKEPFSFILIDGSLKRRTDFRKRIRKGFHDFVFTMSDIGLVPGELPLKRAKAKNVKK